MLEKEGICDDCFGDMEYKGTDIWYCPHCEIFLKWDEKTHSYTLYEKGVDE